jgi:hypothetical protein
MLFLFGVSAMAGVDCHVTEDGYQILRHQLRTIRQTYGRPLLVAGETPQCENALEAVAKNDPLLGIRVVPRYGESARMDIGHSLDQAGQTCGAVLEAGEGGSDYTGRWVLSEVGPCTPPEDTERRTLTAGYWYPTGASLRWNEEIAPGFSLLVDGAMQLTSAPYTRLVSTPDREIEMGPLSWRVLGGFDMANHSLDGYFFGMRGGLQRVQKPEKVEASTVAQAVAGRRWIWSNVALQVGLGGVLLIPEGQEIGQRAMDAGPLVEIRLGLAQ